MNVARPAPFLVLAAFLLTAAQAHGAALHGARPGAEDFNGVLVDAAGSGSVPITLHVDSFTPSREIEALSRTIGHHGQSAAVADLTRLNARGWIRVGKVLGYEVPIIRSFTTTKGQKIVAVLDQPIEIFDQLRRTRSTTYPFGMVELNLDDNGNGNGRLIAATQAMFTSDGKIEMESYGTRPFRIIGVTEQAPQT